MLPYGQHCEQIEIKILTTVRVFSPPAVLGFGYVPGEPFNHGLGRAVRDRLCRSHVVVIEGFEGVVFGCGMMCFQVCYVDGRRRSRASRSFLRATPIAWSLAEAWGSEHYSLNNCTLS